MRYAVVIGKAGDNFSRLCAGSAWLHRDRRDLAEIDDEIREAIRFHFQGLLKAWAAGSRRRESLSDEMRSLAYHQPRIRVQ